MTDDTLQYTGEKRSAAEEKCKGSDEQPVIAVKANDDCTRRLAGDDDQEVARGNVSTVRRSWWNRRMGFDSSFDDNPECDLLILDPDPEEAFRQQLLRRTEFWYCCPHACEWARVLVHQASGAAVVLSMLALAVFLIIYYWKTETD